MLLYSRIFQRKRGEIPPLTRNCNWEIAAKRPLFSIKNWMGRPAEESTDHLISKKLSNQAAHKPGNFGIRRLRRRRVSFRRRIFFPCFEERA